MCSIQLVHFKYTTGSAKYGMGEINRCVCALIGACVCVCVVCAHMVTNECVCACVYVEVCYISSNSSLIYLLQIAQSEKPAGTSGRFHCFS